MNDLKFAFRQLLKHPGFTVHPPQWLCYGGRAVAALTLALVRWNILFLPEDVSGGSFHLGINLAQTDDLRRIDKVPVRTHPHYKEFGSSLCGHRQKFGVSNWQRLAVGEVQLKSAERGPVAHLLDV